MIVLRIDIVVICIKFPNCTCHITIYARILDSLETLTTSIQLYKGYVRLSVTYKIGCDGQPYRKGV